MVGEADWETLDVLDLEPVELTVIDVLADSECDAVWESEPETLGVIELVAVVLRVELTVPLPDGLNEFEFVEV